MTERKTLSITTGTHRQLERLGKTFGLSHKDLITVMAQYFTATKADPRDPKADMPDVALRKMALKVDTLDKRMIGFIREQEKELLKPILSEVRALRTQIDEPVAMVAPPGINAEQLEEQLTGVVEAVQTLLRLSFRTALVDNALRPEYRQQTDALIQQQNTAQP